MAKIKCEICNDEIEKGFMDKIVGTVVKVKDGEKLRVVYVCPFCQKKYGDEVGEQVTGVR